MESPCLKVGAPPCLNPKPGKVAFQKVPFQNVGPGGQNPDLGFLKSEVRILESGGVILESLVRILEILPANPKAGTLAAGFAP